MEPGRPQIIRRRIISWAAVAAVGVGLYLAAGLLPGARGVEGELRWRIARLGMVSKNFDLDTGVLMSRYLRERPKESARAVRRWLDEWPAEELSPLFDVLQVPLMGQPDDAPLRDVVLDWVVSLPLEERAALLPDIGEFWLRAAEPDVPPSSRAWARHEPKLDVGRLAERLSPDETAWVALLMAALDYMRYFDELRFVRGDADRDELLLRAFCARRAFLGEELCRDRPVRRGPCRLWFIIDVDAERLVALLDDPCEDVRDAAGRMLALAGDPRGLPGYCEFLNAWGNDPHADRVLESIYGADWRSLSESCRATRLPRERDGGE